MADNKYNETLARLRAYGQEHLLDGYETLTGAEQAELLKDIDGADLAQMAELYRKALRHQQGGEVKAEELTPLTPVDAEKLPAAERERLTKLGLELIRKGKLAVLTMAGGQGTRLGHDGPKGTFDLGLPSHKSLFELHCDRLRKVCEAAGAYVPWYIMTSELNHAATVEFFRAHGFFGYPEDKIRFFPQTMITPLTSDGKMQRETPSKLLKSPNGNGGMFVSLKQQGCLAELQGEGIEYLMVTGVDNCLIKMADPLFLGALAADNDAEAIAKAYLKRSPDEKSGVFCYRGGRPCVVEYTEIPRECDAGMEYHVAVKKLKYYDPAAGAQTEQAGGFKFELFLFDAFRALGSLKVLRVKREDEFAPVKNLTGEDSAELARQMYIDYMQRSGCAMDDAKMIAPKNKIRMQTPLVEMDGDEMTRVIWAKIKEKVLEPVDSALATKKYGVAVKCATITPNAARVQEYNLRKQWKSPNATIRAILDGTVFRAPILVKGITPLVPGWKKPIVIARHAYGDVYSAVDTKVTAGSKAELVITGPDGTETRTTVKAFDGDGIVLGMHNTVASAANFARACFNYALDKGIDLWFSAKDTILKVYDGEFRKIFAEIYENEYKAQFEAKGISYFYTLVDDAIAHVMKSEGGFLWACKNYDGDVFSDMLATAFGSLAMMTSVLVSPEGYCEFEAAHGTIPRHYHKYLRGEPTSTNPVATLFAWTGALAKRGELDGNAELVDFALTVERQTLALIASGRMTGDLALLTTLENKTVLNLDEFLSEVAALTARELNK